MHGLRPLRYLRSLFPVWGATKEERIGFANFPQPETPNELWELFTMDERRSTMSEDDFRLYKDQAENTSRNLINEWQAGWNITNAIQGMFLVSLPFTVVQGGYWSILAMFIVAAIGCHTGELLVECLYDEDDKGNKTRARDSYMDIAKLAVGKYGGWLLNIAQLIELLMTCILYVLLCGDLIFGSFPDTPLDLSSWIMVSTAFLLPCAFLQTLKSVSWLSFWCAVAHLIINAVIIVYCFTRVHEWQWGAVQIKIDIWTFPISVGIIVFSYTSQIFVPSLEGNLIDRGKFKCMMRTTHLVAAMFKSIFAYIGFLTWGFATQEVVTNNLPTKTLKIIINGFLFAKALLSYPLPYFAAVELLDKAFFGVNTSTGCSNVFPSCTDHQNGLKFWAVVLRLVLVLTTMLMAIFIPHFAILMGLIGSFTGSMLSLVCPCYFHLRIKWRQLPLRCKISDILIILFGFGCCFVGIYFSLNALIRAFEGLPANPSQIQVHRHTRGTHMTDI